MLRDFKKNRFRKSVANLFINGNTKPFALNSFTQAQNSAYHEVISWTNLYDQKLVKYQPYSLKIVNQAFADALNKYEAAALIISHFLAVDTDEEGDWLIDDAASEYSKIYSLFEKRPLQLYRMLETFRDSGDISSEIYLTPKQTFEALFAKYPEFKSEEPEEPAQITWWELAYNDSKNDKHRVVGRFLSVPDVVEYIANKEGEKDLFWRYPFNCQYDDWEPTVPPAKDFDRKSIMAIPRSGWEALWKKYEGHPLGANFDHWEALKKKAYVRPKNKDIITHRIIKKPYQREMSLEVASS